MRSSSWLILAALATTALTGCGDPVAAGKAGNNAATSGRQEVVLRLAHATESAGDFSGAEKMFQQAAAQTPGSPGPRLELAEFYKRHHEDSKAIDSMKAALALQQGDADIERSLANTYINAGEPEKALTVLDSAIAEHPRNALLQNSRGVALDQTGRYAEAQRAYKSAFQFDPSEGTMYKINISMSYILEKKYDRAIEILRPMLDSPEVPPIARQNLALAYGLKGESDSALKLGLQDLSSSEAEENVRFYRMLAQRHHARSSASADTAPVPASVVKELFPESEPQAPITIPATAEDTSKVEKQEIVVPAEIKVHTATVPETLKTEKQQIVVPAEIKVHTAAAPAIPVIVQEQNAGPVVKTTTVTVQDVPQAKPKPVVKHTKPVEPEDDKDDEDDAQALSPVIHSQTATVIAPTAPAPVRDPLKIPHPIMDTPQGDVPANSFGVIEPDEAGLPEPTLKPDEH